MCSLGPVIEDSCLFRDKSIDIRETWIKKSKSVTLKMIW